MYTLDAVAFGETPTPTKQEQKLLTELKALTKQYPVTVLTCGIRYKMVRSPISNSGGLTVSDLVVTVGPDRAMAK